MFEPCRGCDTADLFHFDAYIEGSPWGARMSLIKTQTQPFLAIVRLLSCFSMDLQYSCFVRKGELAQCFKHPFVAGDGGCK